MQLKIIYFLVKILYSYLESLILYLCVYLPLTCANVTLCPSIAGALVPFSLKTQPTQHSVWDEKNDFSVMQIKKPSCHFLSVLAQNGIIYVSLDN